MWEELYREQSIRVKKLFFALEQRRKTALTLSLVSKLGPVLLPIRGGGPLPNGRDWAERSNAREQTRGIAPFLSTFLLMDLTSQLAF